MSSEIDALVYGVRSAFPDHDPIDLIQQMRKSLAKATSWRIAANCFTLTFPAPSRPAAGVAVAGDWKGTITLKVTDPDSLRWFRRLAGGSDFPVPGPPHQVRRRHPALAMSLSLPEELFKTPMQRVLARLDRLAKHFWSYRDREDLFWFK